MADIVILDDDNFEAEVLNSEGPVLIDCWAQWCSPCHLMKPEIEALAEEQGDRLKVAMLDVDHYPILTQDFCDIEMLPTCILFVRGEPRARVVGYHVKNEILWEIEPFLARRPNEMLPPTTSATSEY
ncbi:MAG: thioredoxin [Actinomycetota bacterium]